ncbi:MAG: SoxR reducing system RseC family protein [Candidatus Aminicenantes bacterium]|nr:SoxR reducing system RseC family protein [Candidatus Aminicenantes bacterium]
MKDIGVVCKIMDNLAEVEITPIASQCEHCPARSLCGTNGHTRKGYLTVKNPLQAKVGDQVEIEIPEDKYQTTLIFIFGTFLIALLGGALAGYLLAFLLNLEPAWLSLTGLIIALIMAGIFVKIKLNQKNKESLWPTIVNILAKGVVNG